MEILGKELKLIGLLTLFVFIFFTFIIGTDLINKIDNLPPLIQFIVFNLGIYTIIYGIITPFVDDKKKGGEFSIGSILLIQAMDILLPEYHVTKSGLLEKGGTLGMASPDYILGYIGQHIGITGSYLYYFTYIASFIILMTLSAIFIKDLCKEV